MYCLKYARGLPLKDMSNYQANIPSKDAIATFIDEAETPVTKREVAAAFGIKGQARIPMKRMLKELVAEGRIEQTAGKTYRTVDTTRPPSIAQLTVTQVTIDGEVLAEPMQIGQPQIWAEGARIEINPDPKKSSRAPAPGDQILARIHHVHDDLFYADVLKLLGHAKPSVIGRVIAKGANWVAEPVDRRDKYEYMIDMDEAGTSAKDLKMHDLVEVAPIAYSGHGPRKAKLKKIIGHDGDVKAISLIAIHEYGLRNNFSEEVLAETRDMKVPPLGKREDLRKVPLVTIDGADARDFDDAVFAEKDTDPKNPGGYHLIVAIADVSYYVRSGQELDKEAFQRGNSTYFPDRVVPMLPEALSNDLCSLRPKEDRACMAMHMWIDAHGKLLRYRPVRALMRSAARLIYEQVQAAMDGVVDETTDGLVEPVLRPLYDVYDILLKARVKRGSLDIEMPERQVIVDAQGNMSGVKERERLDSHRLIEEFMVLANVAAARALEDKDAGCIYRVHGRPSNEKLDSARGFLETLGYSLPKGQVVKPENLNAILHKARDTETAHVVNTIILRSQAQALYHPENEGHFGLGLDKYAHFTSPIRRYADLIVHRSLARAYGLGDGGLTDREDSTLHDISDNISKSERKSMEAERASIDRFTASWLSERTGYECEGRISGVSRFGLFIRLNENGAEGIVPIRSLPNDFYIHDEHQHALIGRRSRRVFRLCAPVRVRIANADRLTGSASFELLDAEKGAEIPGFTPQKTPFKDRKGKGKPYPKRKKTAHGKGAGGAKKKKKTTPKHLKRKGANKKK